MKFKVTGIFLAAFGCLLVAACNTSVQPPETAVPAVQGAAATCPDGSPAGAIKPAISLNVLMVKFVDQAADPIWEAAVNPPKTDQEWEQVEYHATQLATTGTLMEVGGTGPMDATWACSPDWTPYTRRMTQAALLAASAAKLKNVDGVREAGDQIVLNCEGCHRAFKLDLPTEGLATHLTRGIIKEE